MLPLMSRPHDSGGQQTRRRRCVRATDLPLGARGPHIYTRSCLRVCTGDTDFHMGCARLLFAHFTESAGPNLVFGGRRGM